MRVSGGVGEGEWMRVSVGGGLGSVDISTWVKVYNIQWVPKGAKYTVGPKRVQFKLYVVPNGCLLTR